MPSASHKRTPFVPCAGPRGHFDASLVMMNDANLAPGLLVGHPAFLLTGADLHDAKSPASGRIDPTSSGSHLRPLRAGFGDCSHRSGFELVASNSQRTTGVSLQSSDCLAVRSLRCPERWQNGQEGDKTDHASRLHTGGGRPLTDAREQVPVNMDLPAARAGRHPIGLVSHLRPAHSASRCFGGVRS